MKKLTFNENKVFASEGEHLFILAESIFSLQVAFLEQKKMFPLMSLCFFFDFLGLMGLISQNPKK